jgi:two-component system, sensor histidine kinase and response regulator
MPSRILLIDDDEATLRALFEALSNLLADVTVDTALDAYDALDFLRGWQYAAVISDIRMPGMDGLALLNQVRERWPEVPVILMTAAGWSHEAQALYDGAFAFLEKPLDVVRLGRSNQNGRRTRLAPRLHGPPWVYTPRGYAR